MEKAVAKIKDGDVVMTYARSVDLVFLRTKARSDVQQIVCGGESPPESVFYGHQLLRNRGRLKTHDGG